MAAAKEVAGAAKEASHEAAAAAKVEAAAALSAVKSELATVKAELERDVSAGKGELAAAQSEARALAARLDEQTGRADRLAAEAVGLREELQRAAAARAAAAEAAAEVRLRASCGPSPEASFRRVRRASCTAGEATRLTRVDSGKAAHSFLLASQWLAYSDKADRCSPLAGGGMTAD